jgi:hypothetical protein
MAWTRGSSLGPAPGDHGKGKVSNVSDCEYLGRSSNDVPSLKDHIS